jgi:hypothetical protein
VYSQMLQHHVPALTNEYVRRVLNFTNECISLCKLYVRCWTERRGSLALLHWDHLSESQLGNLLFVFTKVF